jgi:pimeloyl-ACP methyl ester carboxylesterase
MCYGPVVLATYMMCTCVCTTCAVRAHVLFAKGDVVLLRVQVGCGNTFLASNNSCPPPSQLTTELYLQQIDALRDALKLKQFHLYGQGIGGMLALSYAAQKGGKQAGVLSASVGSVAPSYKQLISDRQAAAEQLLGADNADALLQANLGASGSSGSDAAAAWQQYQQQYVCRFPAATAAGGCALTASQQRSQAVFDGLAGGQYFAAAGALVDWSLDSIDTSALKVKHLVNVCHLHGRAAAGPT